MICGQYDTGSSFIVNGCVSLGSGLAVDKRNVHALNYRGDIMIRPDPNVT